MVVVFYFNNQSKINSTTNIELKIDSIKYKQDSLRLILPKIDSQIISKEGEYEKTRYIIINQSIDSDCSFFTNYLKEHLSKDSGRLNSLNNSRTIERNHSKIDSLRVQEINQYKANVDKLKKSIKIKNTLITGISSGFVVSLLLLLFK